MSVFTIDLLEAQQRIQRWQDAQAAIRTALINSPQLVNSPVLTTKAFTFQWDDLAELMNRILLHNSPTTANLIPLSADLQTTVANIDAIRFYLNIDEIEGTPTAPFGSLISVAVSEFNPESNEGGNDELQLLVSRGSGIEANAIYDFSYPCPATCPNPGHGIMDDTLAVAK